MLLFTLLAHTCMVCIQIQNGKGVACHSPDLTIANLSLGIPQSHLSLCSSILFIVDGPLQHDREVSP